MVSIPVLKLLGGFSVSRIVRMVANPEMQIPTLYGFYAFNFRKLPWPDYIEVDSYI